MVTLVVLAVLTYQQPFAVIGAKDLRMQDCRAAMQVLKAQGKRAGCFTPAAMRKHFKDIRDFS